VVEGEREHLRHWKVGGEVGGVVLVVKLALDIRELVKVFATEDYSLKELGQSIVEIRDM
jgi:hypothetical protein